MGNSKSVGADAMVLPVHHPDERCAFCIRRADVTTMPDSDVFTSLLELLISQLVNGSFTWVDWLLAGAVVAHFLATAYINFTDTPDDNTAYGKLYRYLLEPLAGVIFKHKVKQKPFSDIRLK